jgi:Secretion system C-terminal sorting domain
MKKFISVMVAVIALCAGSSFANGVITVDGSLSESQYITLATKLNSNSGFGSAIDVSKIVYYPDLANSTLYLGIVGKLDASSNNGIGVWLRVTGSGAPASAPAGTSLGVQSSSNQHYITTAGNNSSSNINFKADFPVTFEFAFNPGSGSSAVYFNAAKWNGSSIVFNYQGSCDQSGTSATNSNGNGTVFTLNSVAFAFNNGGGADQGLEMAIPFGQLGSSVTSADSIEVFAFVVSNDAYFSDVTVPGDITTGNPGYNPTFGTTPAGGPFSSPDVPLPVEMSSYAAVYSTQGITLSWKTQTEINNAGFNIYRKASTDASYTMIAGYQSNPSLRGMGTSTSGQSYSFTDSKVTDGATYDYKIEDVTTTGSTKDYGPIRVDASSPVPTSYALDQNYPNPFNPSTTINIDVKKTGYARLEIFNSLGQKVATLLDGPVQAGARHFVWNASSLPSGVYLYRFTTDGFTAMKKMLMLK